MFCTASFAFASSRISNAVLAAFHATPSPVIALDISITAVASIGLFRSLPFYGVSTAPYTHEVA